MTDLLTPSSLPSTFVSDAEWKADLQRLRQLDQQASSKEKRERCRTDLFYLLVEILQRKDADNDWVRARCAEVQAARTGIWTSGHAATTNRRSSPSR
jgi:hypothetical protein